MERDPVAEPVSTRPLRVLVCPQEFKGSLTASEAAAAIAEGVRRALPAAEVVEAPMADGGPGTVELVCAAAGGELVDGQWRGPLGDPVRGAYALLPGGLAVVEAATTAGLLLVPEQRRDPARASTYGVGEQIRDALRRGARRVTVGVGGTGTNDGGGAARRPRSVTGWPASTARSCRSVASISRGWRVSTRAAPSRC